MWCDVMVFVILVCKERVTCTDVCGWNLLDKASEFPLDAISVGIILQTQLCAQGAAV